MNSKIVFSILIFLTVIAFTVINNHYRMEAKTPLGFEIALEPSEMMPKQR